MPLWSRGELKMRPMYMVIAHQEGTSTVLRMYVASKTADWHCTVFKTGALRAQSAASEKCCTEDKAQLLFGHWFEMLAWPRHCVLPLCSTGSATE